MAYYPLSSADILHHLSSCPSYLHSGLSQTYFHLSSSPFTTPTYQPEPPPRANLLPCPPPKPPDPFPFLSTSQIYFQPPHTHQILQPHPPWQEFTKKFTSISPPAKELLQHRDEPLRSPSRIASPSLAPPRAPPWKAPLSPPPTSDPTPNLPPLPPIGVSEKGATILPQPSPATAMPIPATAIQPPPLKPPFTPSSLASDDETKEKDEESSTPPREPPRTPPSLPQAPPRPPPDVASSEEEESEHVYPMVSDSSLNIVENIFKGRVFDIRSGIFFEKVDEVHRGATIFTLREETISRWFVVAMKLDSKAQSQPSIKIINGSQPSIESTIHVLLNLPLLPCHVALSHVPHILIEYCFSHVALQQERLVLQEGGAELVYLVNNFGSSNTHYILGPNFNFEDKKSCEPKHSLLLFQFYKEFNLEDKVDFEGVGNDRRLGQRKIKRIIGPIWRKGVG